MPERSVAPVGLGRRTKEATMTTKLVALVLLCLMTGTAMAQPPRSEEHTSELQSRLHLVCRLLLEKKKKLTRLGIERALRGQIEAGNRAGGSQKERQAGSTHLEPTQAKTTDNCRHTHGGEKVQETG